MLQFLLSIFFYNPIGCAFTPMHRQSHAQEFNVKMKSCDLKGYFFTKESLLGLTILKYLPGDFISKSEGYSFSNLALVKRGSDTLAIIDFEPPKGKFETVNEFINSNQWNFYPNSDSCSNLHFKYRIDSIIDGHFKVLVGKLFLIED